MSNGRRSPRGNLSNLHRVLRCERWYLEICGALGSSWEFSYFFSTFGFRILVKPQITSAGWLELVPIFFLFLRVFQLQAAVVT